MPQFPCLWNGDNDNTSLRGFFLKIKTLICKALGKTQKHINKCDDIDNDDGDVLYNHSHALS